MLRFQHCAKRTACKPLAARLLQSRSIFEQVINHARSEWEIDRWIDENGALNLQRARYRRGDSPPAPTRVAELPG